MPEDRPFLTADLMGNRTRTGGNGDDRIHTNQDAKFYGRLYFLLMGTSPTSGKPKGPQT